MREAAVNRLREKPTQDSRRKERNNKSKKQQPSGCPQKKAVVRHTGMEEFDSSWFDWGVGGMSSIVKKVRGACDSFKSQDAPGGRLRERWKRKGVVTKRREEKKRPIESRHNSKVETQQRKKWQSGRILRVVNKKESNEERRVERRASVGKMARRSANCQQGRSAQATSFSAAAARSAADAPPKIKPGL